MAPDLEAFFPEFGDKRADAVTSAEELILAPERMEALLTGSEM